MSINKKGATSLAILILVIMTLILTSSTLIVLIRSSPIDKEISNIGSLDEVYIKEEEIMFFLTQGGDENKIKENFEIEDGLINVINKEVVISKNYGEDLFIIYKFDLE